MSDTEDRSLRPRRSDFAQDYQPAARDAFADDATALAYAGMDAAQMHDAAGVQQPALPVVPIVPPILLSVSGLYEHALNIPLTPIPQRVPFPIPQPIPRPTVPIPNPGPRVEESAAQHAQEAALVTLRETLRLDVDGRYPQMTVSGTIYRFLTERTHWIARLTRQADGSWTGPIWYKDGDTTAFLYTQVRVTAVRSLFPASRTATVAFSGGSGSPFTRTYRWSSTYFRPVELEYDTVVGAPTVTSIGTHAHPRHPASLPNEALSIERVYQRAGFDVTRSGDGPIPLARAGADARWSTTEMHDAMQIYWSRFANRPQWAVWTLFASLSDQGTSLGGIMFDDIGPNHRQGTAIFGNAFIATPPAGDPAPAAWVSRMRFWTAVHELGHTFNLAHSWQKAHPASWGNSWIPLANDPEARSFMNYPYNVSGGQSAFFGSFEYRFSDAELLFMRHAPERFVQQGNADWFKNHGFEQVRISESPSFRLELRTNQGEQPKAHAATHRFLDQIVVEFKLTNMTDDPALVDKHLLETVDRLTVVIKRENAAAKVYAPPATICWHGRKEVLMPGESMYASLYLSAGKDGFYVAEPGRYVVQSVLHLEHEDILSNVLQLRVLPPRGYEEEAFGQELFTRDVGRVLAFDGTRALDDANATLREAVDRFPGHPLATHARVALAMPQARTFKELRPGDGESRLRFEGIAPEYEDARELLHDALAEHPAESARTLGHIDFAEYGARYANALAEGGDHDAAAAERESVIDGLRARGVKPAILEEVREEQRADVE